MTRGVWLLFAGVTALPCVSAIDGTRLVSRFFTLQGMIVTPLWRQLYRTTCYYATDLRQACRLVDSCRGNVVAICGSEQGCASVNGLSKRKSPTALKCMRGVNKLTLIVVAGTGFEPVTFRL